MAKNGKNGNGGSKGRGTIQSGIGDDFFLKFFRGRQYPTCLVELIKNGRDYGASLIQIITQDPDELVIIDNGEGMTEENQSAFISVDRSTKRGSALFGTGAKMLIFSHSVSFTIRTVSKERQDEVCTFSCTTEELNTILRTAGTRQTEYEPRTSKNWPYPFSTGTEITFKLREPKRAAILRGSELAQELSARLPMKFGRIVSIDGMKLPEKSVVGEVFDLKLNHPQLGDVAFEVYRPSETRKETDGLLFGSGEVGEVPVRDLHQNLDQILRSRVPAIFLLNTVSGFISIPYLRKYANEDRKSIDSGVANDPNTAYLIDLLRSVEVRVRTSLQLESKGNVVEHERVLQELETALQSVYGTKTETKKPSEPIPDESENDAAKKHSPFRLRLTRREFAIGETVEVILDIDESVAKSNDLSKIAWSVTGGVCRMFTKTGRGITFTAEKKGDGTITADLPGTPYDANANIVVVEKRRIRFSQPRVFVTQGTTVVLWLRNLDTLRGNSVLLRSTGINAVQLAEQKDRIVYSASVPEISSITVTDNKDASHFATCEVETVPPLAKVLLIHGEKFRIEGFPGLLPSDSPPADILRGDDVHTLYLNPLNQHAVTAFAHGDGRTFMVTEIGYEIARFLTLKRVEEEGDYDAKTFVRSIRDTALEISAEILQGKKSKS